MDWTQVGMFWATVGLVGVSVMAALINYFLLREALDPHVIVYATDDEARPPLLLIVVKNVGRGVAHNVRIRTDRPVPRRTTREKSEVPLTALPGGPFSTGGIPMLGPGERRVIAWGTLPGLREALEGRPIRVTCDFESKRRRMPFDPTEHSTESVLEVESFSTTDADRKPPLRVAAALEDIAQKLGER